MAGVSGENRAVPKMKAGRSRIEPLAGLAEPDREAAILISGILRRSGTRGIGTGRLFSPRHQ
jgi:hypothetical protein